MSFTKTKFINQLLLTRVIRNITFLFKTIFILCGQLSIVLGTCFYCIRGAKKAYENNTSFVGIHFRASMNMNKQLDLVPYYPAPNHYPCEMFKQVPSKDNPAKSDTVTVMAMDKDHRIKLIKDGYMDKQGGVLFILHLFYGPYHYFYALSLLQLALVLKQG